MRGHPKNDLVNAKGKIPKREKQIRGKGMLRGRKGITIRIVALAIASVAIATGGSLYLVTHLSEGGSSDLKEEDFKVKSWELIRGGGPFLWSRWEGHIVGKIAVANAGDRPFYFTKVLINADNQIEEGFPYLDLDDYVDNYEQKEITVKPGENKRVKVCFDNIFAFSSSSLDFIQDGHEVKFEFVAKTSENETLVVAKTTAFENEYEPPSGVSYYDFS